LSVARDSPLPSPCIDVSVNSVVRTEVSSSSSSIQTNWTKLGGTPARVLDVACGSGVWVLEMATSFPNSHFYGIDFACIYPNTIKPANTHFNQGDILDPEGFPYPDEYFDYIHMRLVYNCFSLPDLKVNHAKKKKKY
jgi:ubiquinone/menaquinone biosynthesis C-methylase UbiE